MANLSQKELKQNFLSPLDIFFQVVKISRPLHWFKNFSIFAALVFSGNLLTENLFLKVVIAFVSFNLATSATYIFNDIQDIEQDRRHPLKKERPLASNKLTLPIAIFTIIILSTISLLIAAQLNTLFLFSLLGYLSLQGIYSLGLKNVHILDILIIASGFVLRVYAGAFVADAHLSVWFLLCVISVALFLASGKRRAELGTIPEGITRKSLSKYSRELLNSYVTMFGNAAWMSWALFTFFESPPPNLHVWLFLAEISRTTTISKLLMITIPVAIFGIMRYQAIIFEDKAEAPEKLFLTDRTLITAIGLWVIIVVWVLYGGVVIFS